jgi:sigma-54-specific transcriptional regulator
MSILEFSRPIKPSARASALVFESPVSRALLTLLDRIAPTDTTVLVTGETGTGKEVVARYLHDHSARAGGPFLAVNCGALSASLLDSELFGYERGAFTGALAMRPGWFEAANEGTLFLDEVADLPLEGQVKLLRVLQEREVVRVGGRRAAQVDVRLIAATNANLQSAVAAGRFREDLFYRLHVAHVALAPIRDRREDILPLAGSFLSRHASRFGFLDAQLTDMACEKLVRHDWPGNIRELENVIQRSLLSSSAGRVEAEHVRLVPAVPPVSAPGGPHPTAALSEPPVVGARPAANANHIDEARAGLERALRVLLDSGQPNVLEEIDAIVFRAAYDLAQENQVRTARLLGISRNIVRSRLMRHGLIAPDSRRSGDRGADETCGPVSVTRSGSIPTAW